MITASRRLLLAGVSLLLASVCFAAVVAARWGVCLTDRDACFAHEDDLYDVLLWESQSPQLAARGLGYLLLALGFLFQARRGNRLAAVVLALPALAMALSMTQPPYDPRAAEPTVGPLDTVVPALIWFGSLLTVPAGFVFMHRQRETARRSALFVAGALLTLLLFDTIVVAGVLTMPYYSHDTNPWTWLSTALGCLLLAGLALTTPRSAPHAQEAPHQMV